VPRQALDPYVRDEGQRAGGARRTQGGPRGLAVTLPYVVAGRYEQAARGDPPGTALLVFRRSGPKADAFDVALELDRGRTVESPLLSGFAEKLDELFDLD
jgi:hypothetical protein